MHTKSLKVLLLLIGFPILLLSQTNHGFSFDNYSGIYGVISNPANSVDSKYTIHVNVLSYNQLGVSDIGSLTNFMVEANPNGFNGLDFSKNKGGKKSDGYSFGHSDVLLPSVSWNFHENYSIGLLSRRRTIFDYNNVDTGLLQVLNSNAEGEAIAGFDITNGTLNNTAHSWTEVGLNLSAVLLNTNYHFVKFGGTFKYYMGNRATEIRGPINGSYGGNDLNINSANDRLISLNTSPISGDDDTSESFVSSAFNLNSAGSGVGGDIGIVYEWRPRETNRVDVRSNSSAVNKYKLKISASVLDVGAIEYKDAIRDSILVNNVTTIPINAIRQDNNLISALIDNGNTINIPRQGDVKFALPRSLHLNVDYIILNDKNYYINFNYVKGLTKTDDVYANTQMDLITVTPRYETRKLSLYLPVSYESKTGAIAAGLGARYGPVTIGAAALSSLFTDRKMHHLYLGVSIPLMKELYR